MDIQDRPIQLLFSEREIQDRIAVLAQEIAASMGENVMIVSILKGSFVFAADLIRSLHHAGMRPRIDFMTLSSYGTGTESKGEVTITRDISDDIREAEVLVIDDILESGRTLAFARDLLLERGAKACRLCILLDKPEKRSIDLNADFTGFRIPDRFVIGYGLDYAHYFRELPYIGYFAD